MQIQVRYVSRNRAAAPLFLSVILAATAWAQVQTGRIVGTITDAQKAALSTATITVTEAATNQSVTAHANERGDFVAPSLNPGLYRVTVSSAGFQTTVINSVEVQVGQSARVDVEMKVG